MRILCISDTHGQPPDPASLPDVDVLIFAGDATMRGRVDEWARFAAWLGAVPARAKVVLDGNHDPGRPPLGPGVINPHGQEIDALGLRVWGWAGSSFRDPGRPMRDEQGPRWWAHWKSDRAQTAALEAMPEGLDILVTHTPPAGILDECPAGRVGCPALRARLDIMERPPRLCVFGHIHESAGVAYGHRTIMVNAAWLDGWYRPWGREPIVIDL